MTESKYPDLHVEIRSTTGAVLFTSDAATLKAALQDAYLRGANLQDANLQGADLPGANLQDAYLPGAYLRGAYLRGAVLRGAYLRDAYLRGANLRGANLRGADLQDADLQGVYLQGANLRGANLRGANLRGAVLRGADLQGADLPGAKNTELAIAQTRILPDVGEIIGWKKANDNRIVQLRIPSDARRSHASGRKCRAERAEVLAIFDEDGNPADVAFSLWDDNFRYEMGAMVEPITPFDPDMWNECSSGIHFYITRVEAENHV